MQRDSSFPLLLLCFFLSGLAGLVYETRLDPRIRVRVRYLQPRRRDGAGRLHGGTGRRGGRGRPLRAPRAPPGPRLRAPRARDRSGGARGAAGDPCGARALRRSLRRPGRSAGGGRACPPLSSTWDLLLPDPDGSHRHDGCDASPPRSTRRAPRGGDRGSDRSALRHQHGRRGGGDPSRRLRAAARPRAAPDDLDRGARERDRLPGSLEHWRAPLESPPWLWRSKAQPAQARCGEQCRGSSR